MNRNNFYSYRFGYKIATYALAVLCIALSVAWISTSISRDNSSEMEMYWRSGYIESRAMLNYSMRENDILIDVMTAQESGVCEIYCEHIRQFKLEHAKRHGNDN
jgi:hypothetical protein